MIVLERKLPIIIQKEGALLPRFPQTHQSWLKISNNLENHRAGYWGEKQTDYYLDMLPQKDYYIFRNLRLMDGKFAFEIDTLILLSKFLLIVESKNIGGTLLFDRNSEQLIRIKDGKEKGFQDPIAQVRLQMHHLKNWLEQQKIKSCPIEYFIVISSSSTILKTTPGHHSIFEKVTHAVHLLEKLKELDSQYTEPFFTPYLLQKLSKLLLDSHTPLEVNILQHYNIHPREIHKGVACPSCSAIPMERKHSMWFCPVCSYQDKQAHLRAIEDFFLLISPTITCKQCKDFLLLTSRYTATRLLDSMNLAFTGNTKGRVYFKPCSF